MGLWVPQLLSNVQLQDRPSCRVTAGEGTYRLRRSAARFESTEGDRTQRPGALLPSLEHMVSFFLQRCLNAES